MKSLLKVLIIFALIVSFVGIGCKKEQRAKTPEEIEAENMATLPNYFTIDAQLAGQKVIVKETKFEKPGFMVIHEVKDDGGTGTILGYSNIVPQGYGQKTKIALTTKLNPAKEYIGMMHDDTDGDTRFNEKKDLAINNPLTGAILEKRFKVTQ